MTLHRVEQTGIPDCTTLIGFRAGSRDDASRSLPSVLLTTSHDLYLPPVILSFVRGTLPTPSASRDEYS